jgi:hypothetical protein
MTYTINKSNGTKLVDVLDGTIDETTNLKLIGKNATTFGEALNEDLVFLLENFSNSIPPSRPLTGQIWYNTADSKLQVYSGLTGGWRTAGSPIVSQTQPASLTTGDLWINSFDKQLYFFDGTALTLAGPIWSDKQGTTGFVAETLYDEFGNSKPILKLWVNNVNLGMFSSAEFVPVPAMTGYTIIRKGYTSNSAVSSTFDLIAIDSTLLGGVAASGYLRRDSISNGASTMTVPLYVANNSGVTVGTTQNAQFKVSGYNLQIENTRSNGNISIRTTKTSGTDIITDNIVISASNGFVGINNSLPGVQLDITGNIKASGTSEFIGNLYVNTDKFTVAASTGNTVVAGTLNVTGLSTLGSAKINSLTSGRVLLAGSSGLVQDNSKLTFNNSTLAVTGNLTVSGKILTKPIALSLIDNDILVGTDVVAGTITILNQLASPSDYLDTQKAIIRYTHINFLTSSVDNSYNKSYTLTGGVWTLDSP